MKRIIQLLALILACQSTSYSYTLSLSIPGSGVMIAAAWQGANTTVGSAFQATGLNANDEVFIYLWNPTSQSYESVEYVGATWTNPNLSLKNTAGFLLQYYGSRSQLVLSGQDTPGTEVLVSMEPNKWYLIGYAYPKSGRLEKPPYPYNPSPNLNFPGRWKSANGNLEDEAFQWEIGNQAWIRNRRASDDSCLDRDNPTGGYGVCGLFDNLCNILACNLQPQGAFGARWRPPGMTNGYSGNGASPSIAIGEPVFFKHQGATNRVWRMPKFAPPVCPCQ